MKIRFGIKNCCNCTLGFQGIKICKCCNGVWWACPTCTGK